MKLTSKISRMAQVLIASCCLASCNYLDVIPPAQADFEDTMKDEEATLSFLYTCYGCVPRSTPYHYHAFEQSVDEIVEPYAYANWQQQVAWGTISPSYANGWGGDDMNIWTPSYNWLGYVHHFLSLIDELNPVGVTAEDKAMYKAECYFLEAYYHFRVLQAFGPCPIIPAKVDPNITSSDIPGRSHFDYCVDFIVGKLDDAINSNALPPTRTTRELGRATSTIAKALKARVLLYAASPLWNGSFPHPEWKNTNYETEGYGKELVSSSYSRAKWERALTACQQAFDAAKDAGYDLFDIETANTKAASDKVGLPFVPGRENDTEENNKFKERVRMFQYLVTANEGDNNKELIWAQRIDLEYMNGGEGVDCRLPNKVVKRSNGVFVGGWGAMAPTLYAVQHFYTENGKLPGEDPDYYDESDWYTRYYGGSSPELATNQLDGENIKNDIIKLNAKREARFYAWITFDGTQYSSKINNGGPLWLNLKNSNTNGYDAANPRNCAGSGYLSRKFIDPNIQFNADGSRQHTVPRRPLIRMAELYLNLAECYAALENTGEALSKLNDIRDRAGISKLKESDITSDMTLMDWVRNERFVELYEEGHRYYDLRRWAIAPQMLKAGTRYGLDGLKTNPSFEEFNKPTLINQPFMWDDKLYLLPVWSRSDMDELYSNPQLVQAPKY